MSAHREENVDNPTRLKMLLECLNAVHDEWSMPVVVSTHPRTRKRLEENIGFSAREGVHFMEPFGFHDYNKLQLDAACVLSDTGTISEEASLLGFPAVTLRESIERPEAFDTGAIVMTGLDPSIVLEAVKAVTGLGGARLGDVAVPSDYQVQNTSERVFRFILSTHSHLKQWYGLHAPSKPSESA